MSKDDYEYDYDDDGNEIKIRITRDMLKARLAAAEKRADKAWNDAAKSRNELAAMKRRQDNAYWCDRLKTVLDDGLLFATDARVEVKAESVDVHGMYGMHVATIAGTKQAFLHVTFTGDEAVMRFGNFLKEQR
jgi:hypothetical protein